MGAVHAFPAPNADERARLARYQALRQSLRLRINRRARELAERDQEKYFRAMLTDIYTGKFDAELIAWWEPLTGDVCATQRKET